MSYGISVPWAGAEPGPQQWKHWILTTREHPDVGYFCCTVSGVLTSQSLESQRFLTQVSGAWRRHQGVSEETCVSPLSVAWASQHTGLRVLGLVEAAQGSRAGPAAVEVRAPIICTVCCCRSSHEPAWSRRGLHRCPLSVRRWKGLCRDHGTHHWLFSWPGCAGSQPQHAEPFTVVHGPVVTVCRLPSVPAAWQAGFPCGLWDLGSPTRDQTRVPSIGRQILSHWTTREVLTIRFRK